MKLIPLTRGQFAAVDDEDYERLKPYNWQADKDKDGSFRASTRVKVGASMFKIYMSRAVMRAGKGVIVDHENHDTLDNRRGNLRCTSISGNNSNAMLRKDSSSGCCGVSWMSVPKKWCAYINISGKRVNLGYHASKEDAIAARLAANNEYGFHKNHGTKIKQVTKYQELPPAPLLKRLHTSNTSGFSGVHYNKTSKKWEAYVSAKGKKTTLGRLATKEETIAIRNQAMMEREARKHGD